MLLYHSIRNWTVFATLLEGKEGSLKNRSFRCNLSFPMNLPCRPSKCKECLRSHMGRGMMWNGRFRPMFSHTYGSICNCPTHFLLGMRPRKYCGVRKNATGSEKGPEICTNVDQPLTTRPINVSANLVKGWSFSIIQTDYQMEWFREFWKNFMLDSTCSGTSEVFATVANTVHQKHDWTMFATSTIDLLLYIHRE
jgi:hypothetical protein